MKLNYALISRSLIALLFVFAGIQKVMNFSDSVRFIGSLPLFSIPMVATIVTILVIIIEIPVALAFAWGYRLCTTGMILISFTVLTIALIHNHFPADAIMILKNIAIIGGILSATTLCSCGKCPMGSSCKKCTTGKKCDGCK